MVFFHTGGAVFEPDGLADLVKELLGTACIARLRKQG